MNVTSTELIDILNNTGHGTKCCALITKTFPKMLVKGRVSGIVNPYVNGIYKTSLFTGILGANYEAAVNRQRLGEGVAEYFDASLLWNGKGVRHTKYTVRHVDSDRIYFVVKPSQHDTDTLKGKATDKVWVKWHDGLTNEELDFEGLNLSEFLPIPSKSRCQGVRHDVLWRTIGVDSVLEMRYGETYRLVG